VRQAPPVGVTCSCGGAWRAVQALLAGGAAAAFAGWAVLLAAAGAALALPAAGGAAAVAAAAMWRRPRPRPVSLRWDGERWLADGHAGEVNVMLDLGGWMLLRWRPAAGRPLWLALPAAEAGPAWPALRAALFSPAAWPRPVRPD